jgi:hypothetical protein
MAVSEEGELDREREEVLRTQAIRHTTLNFPGVESASHDTLGKSCYKRSLQRLITEPISSITT